MFCVTLNLGSLNLCDLDPKFKVKEYFFLNASPKLSKVATSNFAGGIGHMT